MKICNVVNECFSKYKIEKWNEKKECWEHFRSCFTYFELKKIYKIYLNEFHNCIFRCIQVIDINEKK